MQKDLTPLPCDAERPDPASFDPSFWVRDY